MLYYCQVLLWSTSTCTNVSSAQAYSSSFYNAANIYDMCLAALNHNKTTVNLYFDSITT